MELSLALGRPVSNMTEREFMRWARYAQRRLLPQRRIELYLAQIAMVVAHSAGSNATLSDFLFDFSFSARETATLDEEEVDVEALRQAFDYRPRVVDRPKAVING